AESLDSTAGFAPARHQQEHPSSRAGARARKGSGHIPRLRAEEKCWQSKACHRKKRLSWLFIFLHMGSEHIFGAKRGVTGVIWGGLSCWISTCPGGIGGFDPQSLFQSTDLSQTFHQVQTEQQNEVAVNVNGT
ncbi:hypothetical protein DV515_00013507, partial [Chloebia gouldiae]